MESEELSISDQVFWTVLTVLVLAAMAIRLYRLGNLPDGFYCDEAATGYDAFCLLQTGNALHGNGTPLFFAHYGIDFVESLYTYLRVPFVYLFGLSSGPSRMLAHVPPQPPQGLRQQRPPVKPCVSPFAPDKLVVILHKLKRALHLEIG